jgi:membrane-bound lytic murein transglycosylase D
LAIKGINFALKAFMQVKQARRQIQPHIAKKPQKQAPMRLRTRVFHRLFKRILLTMTSVLLIFDQTAQAMVMSPSDTSIPDFWLNQKNITTTDQAWEHIRTRVLNDESNRIAKDFEVSPELRKRTEFWFDIYTRYGVNDHVIHHVLYPWVIFKVIDANGIVATGKGPLWLRQDRAAKIVRQETQNIRKSLLRLSKRENFRNLSGLEKDLFEKMQEVPGARSRVFREAAEMVRGQLGQRDFFRSGLMNSSRYLPYMEQRFIDEGLPAELTRIPLVESSFNESAFSKVGASGVWQIMPRTGKAFMIVNPSIDERNSPLKSTVAAAHMLRQYHRALKSWPLTITSWNHGIGNIHQAVKRAHSNDLATIIRRYHDGDFKFASANFYTCFLAALHAEKYNELIFNDIAREPFQDNEAIILKNATSVKRIEKITGLNRDQILLYNLDLKVALAKNTATLPRGFELHIPKGIRSIELLGSHFTGKKHQTHI